MAVSDRTHTGVDRLDPWGLNPDWGSKRRGRQSNINTWGRCEAEVGYAWDRPDEYRTGEAPVLGTGYHAGLAVLYTQHRNGEPLSKELAFAASDQAIDDEILAADRFRWDAWNERELKQLARDCISHYVDGEHMWPRQFKVLGVEVEACLPGHLARLPEGWIITIQLDVVLEEPHSGRHLIVDHKTARRKWAANKSQPHKTIQPTWYKHWWAQVWEQLHGETPDVAFHYDIMQHQGFRFERREAHTSNAAVRFAIDQAQHMAEALESGRRLTVSPEHPLCDARWCDWFDECPAGARLRVS